MERGQPYTVSINLLHYWTDYTGGYTITGQAVARGFSSTALNQPGANSPQAYRLSFSTSCNVSARSRISTGLYSSVAAPVRWAVSALMEVM